MSMTNEARQRVLSGAGYYNDRIDGKFGPASKKAAREFLKDFLAENAEELLEGIATTEEEAEPNTDAKSFWDDIEYMDRKEFRCPCNKCNGFPVEPKEKLVRAVDEMRREFRSPVIVVPPDGHSGGSGVRCQEYNDSLPGSVVNSRHVQGKAADFSAPGVPASTIEAYLAKIKANGTIRYWYKIGTGSYHMDVE